MGDNDDIFYCLVHIRSRPFHTEFLHRSVSVSQ